MSPGDSDLELAAVIRSIEAIVGKIGRPDDRIPGTGGDGQRVRYVSFAQGEEPSKIFDEVVWKIDPPLVNSGGASLPNVVLTTPDGASFFAIEANGDPKAWQAQIEQGAIALGRQTAKITGKSFETSDGRRFKLLDCSTERKTLARGR